MADETAGVGPGGGEVGPGGGEVGQGDQPAPDPGGQYTVVYLVSNLREW